MGVTCPACGTENRSVAKFCIECIGSLPTIFAATEISPHLSQASDRIAAVRQPRIRDEAATARPSGFIATTGSASAAATAPQSPPVSSGPRRTVEGRKGLWVSVAAFAIALVIGATGWLVAGAGGLYIYAFGHSGAGAEPEVVTAPVAVATTVVPLASQTTLAASASLTPSTQTWPSIASPSADVAPPASAFVAGATVTSGPKSTVTPTPPTTAATPAAVRVAAKPAAAPPAPVGRASTANAAIDPNAQCTGLGFFAASRCMTAQCAKTEYSAHPACTAVRQQQRLMEEKRNPTMAN